jgi:ABC-2 type transport system permease protein
MNKLFIIIRREYLTRVKSKGFIIGTLLTPLLLVALLLVPSFLMGGGTPADFRVTILDQTGDILLYERAREFLLTENARFDRFQVSREASDLTQLEARKQELNKEISEGRLDAYIVLPASVLDQGRIAYHSKNAGDFIVTARVEDAFNSAVIERRMQRSGLNPEQIGELNRRITVEKFNERGEGEDRWKLITALILMGLLSLGIFGYGAHVMSAVIEEKQSRIVEVLTSSVNPFTLMLGKLIGVGLVGLTQYTVWAISAIILSSLFAPQLLAFGSFQLPHISTSLMVFFVIYFLLGFFLYATLYAMVGAIVSNEDDGQQAQIPLLMLILLGPLAASFVWRQPDSVMATAVSLFPFFTPFAMFLRIAVQQPPLWQIGLSIVLMLAAIFGAVWLAAKIYRIGILMYGKRPTLTEVGKWLKYS